MPSYHNFGPGCCCDETPPSCECPNEICEPSPGQQKRLLVTINSFTFHIFLTGQEPYSIISPINYDYCVPLISHGCTQCSGFLAECNYITPGRIHIAASPFRAPDSSFYGDLRCSSPSGAGQLVGDIIDKAGNYFLSSLFYTSDILGWSFLLVYQVYINGGLGFFNGWVGPTFFSGPSTTCSLSSLLGAHNLTGTHILPLGQGNVQYNINFTVSEPSGSDCCISISGYPFRISPVLRAVIAAGTSDSLSPLLYPPGSGIPIHMYNTGGNIWNFNQTVIMSPFEYCQLVGYFQLNGFENGFMHAELNSCSGAGSVIFDGPLIYSWPFNGIDSNIRFDLASIPTSTALSSPSIYGSEISQTPIATNRFVIVGEV